MTEAIPINQADEYEFFNSDEIVTCIKCKKQITKGYRNKYSPSTVLCVNSFADMYLDKKQKKTLLKEIKEKEKTQVSGSTSNDNAPRGAFSEELKQTKITNFALAQISPKKLFEGKQFRKEIDWEHVNNLKETMLAKADDGYYTRNLVPLIVYPSGDQYGIISGHHRWHAALKITEEVGEDFKLWCLVKEFSDLDATKNAIISNLTFKSLNPLEEAASLAVYKEESNLTNEEIAQKLGVKRQWVEARLILLKQPDEIKQLIIDEKLSIGHIKAVQGLTESVRVSALKMFVKQGYSVRKAEEYAHIMKQPLPHYTKEQIEDWEKEQQQEQEEEIETIDEIDESTGTDYQTDYHFEFIKDENQWVVYDRINDKVNRYSSNKLLEFFLNILQSNDIFTGLQLINALQTFEDEKPVEALNLLKKVETTLNNGHFMAINLEQSWKNEDALYSIEYFGGKFMLMGVKNSPRSFTNARELFSILVENDLAHIYSLKNYGTYFDLCPISKYLMPPYTEFTLQSAIHTFESLQDKQKKETDLITQLEQDKETEPVKQDEQQAVKAKYLLKYVEKEEHYALTEKTGYVLRLVKSSVDLFSKITDIAEVTTKKNDLDAAVFLNKLKEEHEQKIAAGYTAFNCPHCNKSSYVIDEICPHCSKQRIVSELKDQGLPVVDVSTENIPLAEPEVEILDETKTEQETEEIRYYISSYWSQVTFDTNGKTKLIYPEKTADFHTVLNHLKKHNVKREHVFPQHLCTENKSDQIIIELLFNYDIFAKWKELLFNFKNDETTEKLVFTLAKGSELNFLCFVFECLQNKIEYLSKKSEVD